MQLTSADAEFILATQPLDLASYDRTHLPDGRLTPAVRYNVYLLSTDRVTIDLCMPKAPQHCVLPAQWVECHHTDHSVRHSVPAAGKRWLASRCKADGAEHRRAHHLIIGGRCIQTHFSFAGLCAVCLAFMNSDEEADSGRT